MYRYRLPCYGLRKPCQKNMLVYITVVTLYIHKCSIVNGGKTFSIQCALVCVMPSILFRLFILLLTSIY